MIELWINYYSGDFFVGTFMDLITAEKFFTENKESFRDYRGSKYGFPYGTPIYRECLVHD